MARRKKQQKAEETLVDLVEVKGQASDFFETNQKNILGGLALLVFLVGGYIFYTQFVKAPKEKSAMESLLDNYGGTKAANSAAYYAGISYLHLGKYDAAIDYLSDFSANGTIMAYTKYGAIGDAYAEKSDFGNAISNYKKAAAAGTNEVLASYYLKKLGLLYEKQGQFGEAKAAFMQIKDSYPASQEGADIDKYISRVGAKG